jgi:hypothetical protein
MPAAMTAVKKMAVQYIKILFPERGKSDLRISTAILAVPFRREDFSRSSFFKASSIRLISDLP